MAEKSFMFALQPTSDWPGDEMIEIYKVHVKTVFLVYGKKAISGNNA